MNKEQMVCVVRQSKSDDDVEIYFVPIESLPKDLKETVEFIISEESITLEIEGVKVYGVYSDTKKFGIYTASFGDINTDRIYDEDEEDYVYNLDLNILDKNRIKAIDLKNYELVTYVKLLVDE